MKKSQLAAQLYTVRDFMKTPDDVAGTFEYVRKIGYEAVQLSGLCPMEEELIVKYAADNGLTICATHESGATIINEVDSVIERLKKLSCKHTAYPHPHAFPRTYRGAVEFAHKLNDAAEKMAKEGLVLSYHNHAQEFIRYNGEYLLDIIYNNAPALQAEIDTFWVQAGGQNPVKWINKMAGRQPLLHLKDYGIGFGFGRIMQSIGSGSLEWNEIIPAGEKGGVEYFIVEQDDCNGINPFDALRSSYEYISENFFE